MSRRSRPIGSPVGGRIRRRAGQKAGRKNLRHLPGAGRPRSTRPVQSPSGKSRCHPASLRSVECDQRGHQLGLRCVGIALDSACSTGLEQPGLGQLVGGGNAPRQHRLPHAVLCRCQCRMAPKKVTRGWPGGLAYVGGHRPDGISVRVHGRNKNCSGPGAPAPSEAQHSVCVCVCVTLIVTNQQGLIPLFRRGGAIGGSPGTSHVQSQCKCSSVSNQTVLSVLRVCPTNPTPENIEEEKCSRKTHEVSTSTTSSHNTIPA